MAYKHGVYTSEVPTSIIPAVNTTAGLPVVFGTAPVHLATDRAAANKPVLCYSYAEAVAAFGYSKDWKSYTLCEAIYSEFALYNVAPVVLVNVLDPAVHKEAVTDNEVTLTNKAATITDPVLLETLKVKKASAGQALTEGTDYEAAYNLLYDGFKQNYFKTLEEFKEYAEKNYPKYIVLEYTNIERQGTLFILSVKIKDALDSIEQENVVEQQVVIIENDVNDFKISFSVLQ